MGLSLFFMNRTSQLRVQLYPRVDCSARNLNEGKKKERAMWIMT